VNVLSFVDNDDAGRKFERENNFARGNDVLERAGVKDWNDALRFGNVKINTPETTTAQSTAKVVSRK